MFFTNRRLRGSSKTSTKPLHFEGVLTQPSQAFTSGRSGIFAKARGIQSLPHRRARGHCRLLRIPYAAIACIGRHSCEAAKDLYSICQIRLAYERGGR